MRSQCVGTWLLVLAEQHWEVIKGGVGGCEDGYHWLVRNVSLYSRIATEQVMKTSGNESRNDSRWGEKEDVPSNSGLRCSTT